jgi:hypothetical protein
MLLSSKIAKAVSYAYPFCVANDSYVKILF